MKRLSILSLLGAVVSAALPTAGLSLCGCAQPPSPPGDCAPAAAVLPTPTPRGQSRVAIYWDVSQSMVEIAKPASQVANVLDTKVLPLAGQKGPVFHFAVGSGFTALENAGDLPARWLKRKGLEPRTVLHEAGLAVGAQLAGVPLPPQADGREIPAPPVEAAILVSDMDLELDETADASACGAPGTRSSRFAGALFADCVQVGLANTQLGDLYVEVFRSPAVGAANALYVTLFARDPIFGREIANQMAVAWPDFTRTLLVDSAALRATSGGGKCTWAEGKPGIGLASHVASPKDECAFNCNRESAVLHLECPLPSAAPDRAQFLSLATPRYAIQPGAPRAALSVSNGAEQIEVRCGGETAREQVQIETTVTWDFVSGGRVQIDPSGRPQSQDNVNTLYQNLVKVAPTWLLPTRLELIFKLNDA